MIPVTLALPLPPEAAAQMRALEQDAARANAALRIAFDMAVRCGGRTDGAFAGMKGDVMLVRVEAPEKEEAKT